MLLNKFNVGLFAFNASSGATLTKNKNRWKAETKQIINLAKMADDCKLDFLLPVARWSDWGGCEREPKNN